MSVDDKNTTRSFSRSLSSGGDRRPGMLLFCGALGVLGNLAPLGTLIAASVLTSHDVIADMVSDLGRGARKWIMDTGFFLPQCRGAAGAVDRRARCSSAAARGGRSVAVLLAFTALRRGCCLDLLGRIRHRRRPQRPHRLTFFLGPLTFAGPLLHGLGAATAVDAAWPAPYVGLRRSLGWFLATGIQSSLPTRDGTLGIKAAIRRDPALDPAARGLQNCRARTSRPACAP